MDNKTFKKTLFSLLNNRRRRGRRGGTRLEIWCRTEEANGALIVGKTVHPPGWWGVLAVEGRTVFAARVGDKHVTLTSKVS